MKPTVAEPFFIQLQAFKPATAQDYRKTPQRKLLKVCEIREHW